MLISKRKIGLALGSGGPKGFAHIGVIKALLENNIPIDIIAGTSGGSLVGGLYSSLGSIQKVEQIAEGITLKDLSKIFIDIGSFSGIIRGARIESFLEEFINSKKIEDLHVPFAAVATDFSTGEPFVIKKGSLSKAIHASSAIPGLLEHVDFENRLLVDGGVSTPVPVKVVKDMGATFVIAVNLDDYSYTSNSSSGIKKPKAPSTSMAAIRIMRYNLAKEQCREADIVIFPDTSNISSVNLMHFTRGTDIIQRGYQATMQMIPEIQKKLEEYESGSLKGKFLRFFKKLLP